MGKSTKRSPEFVIKDGEPVAVIIGLKEYEEMLERLEDQEDLEALRRMRKKPLSFRKLEDYLQERSKNA